MPYDITEHRHRFAVWAGARAAQRAFTSVENLRDAIEATDIRSFLERPESLQASWECYERNHKKWCDQIVDFLVKRSVANVTFGRAAKLVAVYVKAMIVTTSSECTSLSSNAHPPIDRALLQKLAASDVQSPHKRYWRTIAWTQLDDKRYYELINQLRALIPANEPFWMLEEYWTVTKE
jgi:hypothetical protein